MKISHVHCHMTDLPAAVRWFGERCDVAPTFCENRMAVLGFGEFTLILDAAPTDITLLALGLAKYATN